MQAHPRQPVGLVLLFYKARGFFRRRAADRRWRRVATDYGTLTVMLEQNPELRKHLRKTLRVKGYES